MSGAGARVVDLGREHLDQAAEVLTRALTPYPTMRWVCRSEEPGFEARLRAVYALSLAMQQVEGQPTLGLLDAGRLVAAAIVYDPGRRLTLRSALRGLFGGLFSAARSTLARGHHYETRIAREQPREPHHFLSVIGVEPAVQRQGHGRLLMDALHARAEGDPASAGVCLDTCDPDNRRYYESLGYEVRSRVTTGPLEQWIMFRPARKQGT